MSFVAARKLEPGVLYRVDRYDTDAADRHRGSDFRTARGRGRGTHPHPQGMGRSIFETEPSIASTTALYCLPWWIGLPFGSCGTCGGPRMLCCPSDRVGSCARHRRGCAGRCASAVRRRTRRTPGRRLACGLDSGAVEAPAIFRDRGSGCDDLRAVALGADRQSVAALWRLFIFERARIKLTPTPPATSSSWRRTDWGRTNGYAELEMYRCTSIACTCTWRTGPASGSVLPVQGVPSRA